MQRFVAYYRVSTQRQGQSGLGLEAQRTTVRNHVAAVGGELLEEFTEIESGKMSDRPIFQDAEKRCRHTGATLIIAKLDRLARDVHFISSLMKAGIDFFACDLPSANKLTIHIFAAMAEHEREMISKRTKEALAVVKKRGTRLGVKGPENLTGEGAKKGRDRALAVRRRRAEDIAVGLYGEIARSLDSGMSFRKTAAMMTERGYKTPGGSENWDATTVRNILKRVDAYEKYKKLAESPQASAAT